MPMSGDSLAVLSSTSETGRFATLAGDGPLFTASYSDAGVVLRA
jgi:hypothetical protein